MTEELDAVEGAASILNEVALLGRYDARRESSAAGEFPLQASLLFSGGRVDDEHVTVWEPVTGKTVAGNAAPYRRNLVAWLQAHPGWEEKADELKSSKRRSAARRAKAAASSFAALCGHSELPHVLLDDATAHAPGASRQNPTVEWSAEEYIRLEEALVRLGEQLHATDLEVNRLPKDRWDMVSAAVSAERERIEVLRMAQYILYRGIDSHRDLAQSGLSSAPAEGSNSVPEASFAFPREPRVTVWEPDTGRTVSGNAAPCKRNVAAWIAAHPGWEVKRDEQLSASRRAKKLAAAEPPEDAQVDATPHSPASSVLSDALEGLLFLSGQRKQASGAMSEDSDIQRFASSTSSLSDPDELERGGSKRTAPPSQESSQMLRPRLRPKCSP